MYISSQIIIITTLYIGITNNLIRRVYEHKNHIDSSSFTAKYNIEKLGQYRIIQVCGLRSKIFRQSVQIIGRHTDVWVPIFGHYDGIIFEQGVLRELCGVALVYYETFSDPKLAIAREKQLKGRNRKYKNSLVEKENPHWIDLYPSII